MLGFDVAGWARRDHDIEGVECFAGNDRFDEFLARTEIVCLLPLTEATRGILDASLFAPGCRKVPASSMWLGANISSSRTCSTPAGLEARSARPRSMSFTTSPCRMITRSGTIPTCW
ncbi:MAG: hypothetical protein R3D03_11260 [Geminicoccaceae bacterium]